MCPGDHTLHLFVNGNLDSGEVGGVRLHVASCAQCQEMVVALGQSEAALQVPWPPARLDEYALHRKLGQGSMGEVYLAHDTRLERQVAIKFIAAAAIDGDGGERLLQEARAVARVQHPNVVAVHRVGEVLGRPYLVTELVDGITLAELNRPLRPEQAQSLGAQIARGLAAAHRQHVLHRDLKLHNVMLTKSGVAKLVDFGLAKLPGRRAEPAAAATPDVRITQTGVILGTPRYLAPELWLEAAATPQSDLYAVGTMLFELLAGVPPFDADSLVLLREQVLRAPVPSLREKAPQVPAGLAAVVERCLAKNPAERFASAEELERALLEPPRTGRRAPLALAAVALTVAIAAGAWWWKDVLPAGERTLALSCAPASPADTYLADAACGLAKRAWCESPQPWRCDASGNVTLMLTVARLPDAVALSVSGGPAGGWLTPVASLRAESVVKGLELLTEPLRRFAADGRPELPPSKAELDAARRIGASSVESYRAYRRFTELAFGTVHVDEELLVGELGKLEKLDPGWAHPWVSHIIQLRTLGPQAGKVLAAARRDVTDPSRDPAGSAMLDALETTRAGRLADAAAMMEPIFRAYPDDPAAGFVRFKLLYYSHEPELATAVARRLTETFPELQFGGDLAALLAELGRTSELERLAGDWWRSAPSNEQALTLQLGLAVENDDRDRVRSLAADRLLIYAGSPIRWMTNADALMAAGVFDEAHALIDRIVALPGRDHARGLMRAGTLAVLEGRFAAAEHAFTEAIAAYDRDPLGEPEQQPMDSLVEMQELLGEDEAARQTRELLADGYRRKLEPHLEAVVRWEQQGCVPIEPFAAAVPEGIQRSDASTALRRAAAAGRCGDCKAVLRAGFALSERSTRSLVHLGRCAAREGELTTAEDAFTRAVVLAPSLGNGMLRYSPMYSVLAQFELAQVLEQRGKRREAAARYDEFLRRWGGAEAQVPQVKEAREAAARLKGAR